MHLPHDLPVSSLRLASEDTAPRTARSKALIAVGIVLGVAICAVAFRALQGQLRTLSFDDVRAALAALPPARLGGALLLVLVSYAWLSNYDRIGLWASHKHPGQGTITATSFVAYAVSKTFGFPALTSGLVRLRRYRRTGFTIADLARFVMMTGTALWLGFAVLMGTLLMVQPTELLPLSSMAQRLLGVLFVAAGLAWLGLASRGIGVLNIKSFHLRLPTTRVAGAQLVVGAIDWILMSSVLWMLLPPGAPLYEVVLAVGAAQIVSVMAHVPGGAGIMEATLLTLFAGRVDTAALAAALVAFRVLYFLVPLALAGLFVAGEHLIVRLRTRPAALSA